MGVTLILILGGLSMAFAVAFTGVAGWSDNVVQPELQKALTGRSTPAQAVDAMIAGLEAAL